jgi:predicted dehydrogenase
VLASVRVDQPLRGVGAGQARATADDAFTLHLEFESATAIVDVNATVPYRWERFEIHGDEGTLRWDEDGERLWRLAPGREPEEVAIPAALRLARAEGEPHLLAPFRVVLARLRAAIRDGAPMTPNFEDAVRVQSVLDAARASSEAGRRVAVEVPAPFAAASA